MGFIKDLRDGISQKRKLFKDTDTSKMNAIQKYDSFYEKLKDLRGAENQPLDYEQIQKLFTGRTDLDDWDVYILSIVYENHCDYFNSRSNTKPYSSFSDRYSMEKPKKTIADRKEIAMQTYPGVYIENIKNTIFSMINQGADVNQFSSTYINDTIFGGLIQKDIAYEDAEQKRKDAARRKYEAENPRWNDGAYGPSQSSLDRRTNDSTDGNYR